MNTSIKKIMNARGITLTSTELMNFDQRT